MSKLPLKIRKKLKEEAQSWDAPIAHENPEKIQELLVQSELFAVSRPTRQPFPSVSIH